MRNRHLLQGIVAGLVVTAAAITIAAVFLLPYAVSAIRSTESLATGVDPTAPPVVATCDNAVRFDTRAALADAKLWFDEADRQRLLRYATPDQRAFLERYAAEAWFLTSLEGEYHDEATVDPFEFYDRAFQLPPLPGTPPTVPPGLLATLDGILAGLPNWDTESCQRQWLEDPVVAQDVYAIALDVWRAHTLCLPPDGSPPPPTCTAVRTKQTTAETAIGDYAPLRGIYEARARRQAGLTWLDFLATTSFWPK